MNAFASPTHLKFHSPQGRLLFRDAIVHEEQLLPVGIPKAAFHGVDGEVEVPTPHHFIFKRLSEL